MGRHKAEVWIGVQEAARVLSERMERTIHSPYIYKLAKAGRVRSRKRDGRTLEYLLSDIQTIKVRQKQPKVAPCPEQTGQEVSQEVQS
jgi:hypothetical protein